MLNMPRGECKKFSAQRCLRCCLKEAVERGIFVNFNRLWPCPKVFVERGIILLNQKLKNPAIALSLVLTPILQLRLRSRFRKASITVLAIFGAKKTRTKMFRVSFKWVQGVDLNH